eukprot:2848936-Pleurochrysis_carterae.AAC.5
MSKELSDRGLGGLSDVVKSNLQRSSSRIKMLPRKGRVIKVASCWEGVSRGRASAFVLCRSPEARSLVAHGATPLSFCLCCVSKALPASHARWRAKRLLSPVCLYARA